MLNALVDRPWKRLILFALVVALTYLPYSIRLTYYRDDWYYAYDALVGPAGIFRALFASDRPARGPFFEFYYALFGMSPLPYHLAMYFWRLIGGLAVMWLSVSMWPRQRQAATAAGLLFAIYPGFTWWVSGIEYQPMVASAALMVVSLALTVQALRLGRSTMRTMCVLGAIVTGWIYLALVEYAAGMEVIRLFVVYLVIDSREVRAFGKRIGLAVRNWLPYLIIPSVFLFWRFVVFSSQRRATDLGAQLGGLVTEPATTGLHWLISFMLSFINVTFSAWVVPLMSNFFSNSVRDILLGLLLALLAGLAGWLAVRSQNGPNPDAQQPTWSMQATSLGFLGLILGILPVVVANRQITFPNFSHYALPASLGLVFLISGLVASIPSSGARAGALSVLVMLSALTHQGLGASALHEERIIANFWQQMAWRAPSIASGTTLVAYYPQLDYGDDTDIVWGPADYIYYSRGQAQIPIHASISALTQDYLTFNNIVVGHDAQESTYRAHSMTLNFDQVLILSQPDETSCVRVIDGRWPILSLSDDPALRLLASFSRADQVTMSGGETPLPSFLFGAAPKHGWCFYFEEAALASQQGHWSEVAGIQDQVGTLGLHPNDQIEWMPFLQAAAYTGDLQRVKEIATRINTEKLYKQQACQNLSAMAHYGYPLPAAAQSYVNELFCGIKP
jgi:hypothetical protein